MKQFFGVSRPIKPIFMCAVYRYHNIWIPQLNILLFPHTNSTWLHMSVKIAKSNNNSNYNNNRCSGAARKGKRVALTSKSEGKQRAREQCNCLPLCLCACI